MTRVGALALRLALSMLDFRVNGLDLLPDAIWLVVAAVMLSRLRLFGTPFGIAASTALVTAVLSVADIQRPTFQRVSNG